MNGTPRIFISATSKALRSYREAARSLILQLSPARNPVVQEDFLQHQDAVTIEAKLTHLISGCDAIICLIGPAYGGEPLHPLPGEPRRSYTQMEYHIAKALGKPVFVLLADDDCSFDPFDPEATDLVALQQQFKDSFNRSGTDNSSFRDLATFEKVIRHLALPVESQHQPICVLPQRSLGNLFVGREDFLTVLHSTLTGGQHHAFSIVHSRIRSIGKPTTIQALGGVGKTRTAIEYAWHYQHEYDALLFVTASSPSLLKDQIAGLTHVLAPHVQAQIGSDLEKQYGAVLQWLHEHSRWFLVLDNVDTPEAQDSVIQLLPRLTKGHVCITTRRSNWPDTVQPLDLTVLTDAQGAAYLQAATDTRRKRTDTDEADACALSGRLGGLALALEHAAAYIKRLSLSYRKYLDKLESNAPAILQWHDDQLVQYPKSIAETWLISIEQLNPDARELLNVLAWLDPAPIPLWFIGDIYLEGNQPDTEELLADLSEWHLIIWSGDRESIKVHCLVQEVTLHRLVEETDKTRTLTQCFQWLKSADLEHFKKTESWPRWISAMPHILRLVQWAELASLWDWAVKHLTEIGGLQINRGLYHQGDRLMKQALSIAQNHLEPDSPWRIAAQLGMITVHNALVRPREALDLARETLAISEKKWGANHHFVAAGLNDLAVVLKQFGRHREALPLLQRALKIEERRHGKNHPEVADLLSNLGSLLGDLGDNEAAVVVLRRALEILKRKKGADPSEIGRTLNNLGQALFSLGKLKEAERISREALTIAEDQLEPNHPTISNRLNNIGLILDRLGKWSEAEPLFRRSLSIREKTLDINHPHLGQAYMHLGIVLHRLQRDKEALPLLQRALSIYTIHGAQHSMSHPELTTVQRELRSVQQALSSKPSHEQRE